MKKGFTLIEVILYLLIAGLILFSVMSLLILTLQSRVKNQVIAEVEESGNQIIEVITDNIKNSSSYALSSPTEIQLDVDGNSVVFSFSDGSLNMLEGGESFLINSDDVVLSDFVFSDLSYPDTPGIISISFKVSYINNENRAEYNYERVFSGAASLRR